MSEDTQFEPMGGYPPIIKKSDLKPTKTTSSTRGFSSANILKIQDILKKGKNIPVLDTITIGGTQENDLIFNEPNDYQYIDNKKIT